MLFISCFTDKGSVNKTILKTFILAISDKKINLILIYY